MRKKKEKRGNENQEKEYGERREREWVRGREAEGEKERERGKRERDWTVPVRAVPNLTSVFLQISPKRCFG